MGSEFPRIESLDFSGMGTELGLLIVVKNEEEAKRARTDLSAAKEKYARLEKIFSRFDPESELSRLNAHLNEAIPASADLTAIAKKSLDYYESTEGIFDPRIIGHLESIGYAKDFKKSDFTPIVPLSPPDISKDLKSDLQISEGKVRFSERMDFSGIVKGFATDQITAFFREMGWRNFLVDSGGDMFAAGRPPESEKWNIAVEGVDEKNLHLSISEKAVATSGISRRKWERDGKRFHHLIHPKYPTNFSFDLRTVSVIADSAEEADVLAKTIFIKDKEEREKFVESQKISAIFLFYSGRVKISSSAKEHCVLG